MTILSEPPPIRPGDIYFVNIKPYQVVGSEQHSPRPFVIVSRLAINRNQGNIVVGVPLTTTRAHGIHPPHRIVIPAAEISKDVLFTGNVLDCVALTDQVRALDKKRLENKMGTLSNTALVAIGLGLAFVFDLQ